VSWSSGMPEKFYIHRVNEYLEHKLHARGKAHHDVGFEDSCEVAELAPSVTIRLPTDLIKPIVEPVTDI
jgi:hypothetical protein